MGSPYKKSVISASLDEYFPSAEECWAALVAHHKAKTPGGTEKDISLEEVSPTEFVLHITNHDDSKATLAHTVDPAAGTDVATYKIGDNAIVSFTFHVRSDPVRLEVSSSWPNDDAMLFDSFQWCQRTLKGLLPRS